MLHAIGSAATAALLLWPTASAAQGVPAPMPVRVSRIWAEPAAYAGPCPVTITFRGALRGSWGSVTYRWVRSDGVKTASEHFTFDNPPSSEGEHVVVMEWRLTGAGEISAAVEIIRDMYNTPQPVTVAPAAATVVCTEASGSAPDPCAYDPEVGPVTSQTRACAQRRYEDAATALDSIVRAARHVVAADTVRPRLFEASQAAWLAYRAAACEAVYWEFFPGTFAPIHRLDCLERLTRARSTELKRTYFDER